MICLSLNYDTFKKCLEVNKAWKNILTSKTFQKKAKAVYQEDISKDETKLLRDSKRGNTEEVRKHLSNVMVNVDCLDKNRCTPLHYAACEGHKDIVQLLLQRGAYHNKKSRGDTPLQEAAFRGHKDVVQLLLDRGADPNETPNTGRTPLYWAAQQGHADVVQLLLDGGADPNRADMFGNTPLHAATVHGYIHKDAINNDNNQDVVRLLLDRGADPNKANQWGITPQVPRKGATGWLRLALAYS